MMNKNERKVMRKGLYWTVVVILFVLVASGCLALMNVANTAVFIVGLLGLVASILYFFILAKREYIRLPQDENVSEAETAQNK